MEGKKLDIDYDGLGLEEAVTYAQRDAVIEIADQGLLSISQLVQNGAIDVSPKFQRRDRWPMDKQALLIESFISNIPVPPVYLAEDAAAIGSYAVIDGKQRLTAISLFFSNDLILKGLHRIPQLNGRRFSDLPRGLQNLISMKNLRVTTLLRQSNDDLKHEVFLRLNTGGEVLNQQEIRNVAYRGPLNELIYDLAENEFLRTQFRINPPNSPAYRQMMDAEFVLRFLTLQRTWRNSRGELRYEMDEFMNLYRFAEVGQLRRMRDSFNFTIEIVELIWGGDAFKRPSRNQALAGMYDAQMIAIHEIGPDSAAILVRNAQSIRKYTTQLFNDHDFDEAVRQGTNTPSRLRLRTERMIEMLRYVAESHT
ncbi:MULTISPECIES: DUF262 domain-containing protein [unclassified Arthrobacter]|uniref:DUF262 domain-containing protein n=1 Tax=unclassified Arthrobacter TaxID=235627 RepID=UPI002883269A|nr:MULTISPECIES: DUF262 domain-containing protein [unclassified Arthrobacter]